MWLSGGWTFSRRLSTYLLGLEYSERVMSLYSPSLVMNCVFNSSRCPMFPPADPGMPARNWFCICRQKIISGTRRLLTGSPAAEGSGVDEWGHHLFTQHRVLGAPWSHDGGVCAAPTFVGEILNLRRAFTAACPTRESPLPAPPLSGSVTVTPLRRNSFVPLLRRISLFFTL